MVIASPATTKEGELTGRSNHFYTSVLPREPQGILVASSQETNHKSFQEGE